MELGIAAGTVGLGYLLSDSSTKVENLQQVPNHMKPSEKNIYNSTHSWDILNAEMAKVSENFENSRNPLETNIIPNNMNQNILNNVNAPIPYKARTEVQNSRAKTIEGFKNVGKQPFYSQLSGEVLNTFFNENMTPFYSGNVTQNVYEGANQARLEFHTGRNDYYKRKREVEPFFLPQKNIGRPVNGTLPKREAVLDRYIPSQYKTNQLPVEQVMVGPGLNEGFTGQPSGGFQQSDKRDYMMPRTVNELRVKSDPKLTYYGRVIPGNSNVPLGGKMGKVYKHRPEGFYKNNPDMWLTTVGAQVKESQRPEQILKYTNRTNSTEYKGSAAPAVYEQFEQRPEIKASSKFIYTGSGPRNLAAPDSWKESGSDYGRKGYYLPPNERDITSERTVMGNLKSIFKELTAPILDTLRGTRKQNVIQNPRQTGNMSMQAPPCSTIYDPNDIARTTIKETNIHNNHNGQLSSFSKSIAYDPNDLARTTLRNTLEEVNKTVNLVGPRRLTIYDPNDVARTTVKETLVDETRLGQISMQGVDKDSGYLIEGHNMQAPTTLREMTDRDYMGIADREDGTGYITSNFSAPNTNKQFTSQHQYAGDANSIYSKPKEYKTTYNSTIREATAMKEVLSRGRKPTQNNVKLAIGGDSINLNTRKAQGDVLSMRAPQTGYVYNSLPQYESCGMTHRKVPLNNNIIANRNDSYVTCSLETNPYTMHALHK